MEKRHRITDGSIFVGGRYWTPFNYASVATGPVWDNYNNQPLDEDATSLVAWYRDGAGGVKPVGQLLPNHLGIYDMSGNLSEWTYTEVSQLDRARQIVHGGAYLSPCEVIQISAIGYAFRSNVGLGTGFRFVRNP